MTLLRLLSDIHLDHGTNIIIKNEGEDVLVIAGDLCNYFCRDAAKEFINNYLQTCTDTGGVVFYVLGNHDYYGSGIEETENFWNEVKIPGLVVFGSKPKVFYMNGVCFVGCTLWTELDSLLWYAFKHLNDFVFISDFSKDPQKYIQLHRESVTEIKKILSKMKTKIVLITHHPPFAQTTPKTKLDKIFYSQLQNILTSEVVLWLHGHIHSSKDYIFKTTRVICNPYYQNETFDKKFIISVRK